MLPQMKKRCPNMECGFNPQDCPLCAVNTKQNSDAFFSPCGASDKSAGESGSPLDSPRELISQGLLFALEALFDRVGGEINGLSFPNQRGVLPSSLGFTFLRQIHSNAELALNSPVFSRLSGWRQVGLTGSRLKLLGYQVIRAFYSKPSYETGKL